MREHERRFLVMSQRAAAQLTPAQRRRIERSCEVLAVPVPTIEAAGGSVRCMLAGIHLPQRQADSSTGIPNTRTTVVPAAV
ncbi:MAG: arginine deiminase-related protein [Brachybacterium sp.]